MQNFNAQQFFGRKRKKKDWMLRKKKDWMLKEGKLSFESNARAKWGDGIFGKGISIPRWDHGPSP